MSSRRNLFQENCDGKPSLIGVLRQSALPACKIDIGFCGRRVDPARTASRFRARVYTIFRRTRYQGWATRGTKSSPDKNARTLPACCPQEQLTPVSAKA